VLYEINMPNCEKHKVELNNLNKKLDQLGTCGSLICAVHCALTPLILYFAVSFGAGNLLSLSWETVDIAFICVAPFIAFFSFKESYFHHRSFLPVIVFGAGFLLLLITHLSKLENEILMVIGGLTIAVSHLYNMKLSLDHHKNVHQAKPKFNINKSYKLTEISQEVK
jgi:hypothetical protein